MKPLTEQEKKFSETNHNLIYGFLNKYQYSIEEFYNVAVVGYLEAVQAFHRKEKYKESTKFSSVAYKYMKSEISNHLRKEKAQKRKSLENNISLDIDTSNNFMNEPSAENKLMEAETILCLMENLSELQRKIARLKVEGYTNKEVFGKLHMKQSTYYKELQRMRKLLKGQGM